MPATTTRQAGRTKYDAGPWSVTYLQVSHFGRRSRPKIVNTRGKLVPSSKPANAVLMAASPELYEALAALVDEADFLLRVLRGEHPICREPEALARARGLAARVRRELMLS